MNGFGNKLYKAIEKCLKYGIKMRTHLRWCEIIFAKIILYLV